MEDEYPIGSQDEGLKSGVYCVGFFVLNSAGPVSGGPGKISCRSSAECDHLVDLDKYNLFLIFTNVFDEKVILDETIDQLQYENTRHQNVLLQALFTCPQRGEMLAPL